MIEKAIFISNTKNLGYVTHAYSRLYFGIEFCERLIPSREELSAAIEFAGRNKMDFTFVTPFVTDNGMEKLARLLDCFSGDQRGSEIVINDWGRRGAATDGRRRLRCALCACMLTTCWNAIHAPNVCVCACVCEREIDR